MKKNIFYLVAILFVATSCLQMPDDLTNTGNSASSKIEDINVPEGFDFKTSGIVKIQISILNGNDKPLGSVPFSVYSEPQSELILSGMTNAKGEYSVDKELGNHIKRLSFRTDMLGVPNNLVVNIEGNRATFKIGGSVPASGFVEEETNQARVGAVNEAYEMPKLQKLGTWTPAGVPNYLEPKNENITSTFLQDITASLPESKPLTSTHADYLKGEKPSTIGVSEKADVWVTFVHEGAGWQNSLGFYTFDPKNPPQKVEDIKNPTLIFPNVSFSGSGGGLVSGNKVKIGTFDAGTSIGFFLLANAFSNGNVGSGYYGQFSHSNLNPESNPDLRRHFVLLDDAKSDRILLSVEDVSRENKPIGCDNDFNDAIFYVTSNPVVAIQDPNFAKMDTFADSDGDGVGDSRDEFPKDVSRAFRSFTPSKTTFSSIAFEDLWPAQGDYDFNDLVLNYQIEEVSNSQNLIVEVKHRSVIKAVGASFNNGFGFQMNALPSSIKKVSGNSLKNNIVKTDANGTEAEQSKSVIIVFENAFDKIKRVGSEYVNTMPDQAYSTADTMDVLIEFSSPQISSTIGVAPYNPFIFVNGDRGKEIHLANYVPTDKANTKYLGTYHDLSVPSKGKYYKNWKNLPWAINIPVNFEYPLEKKAISEGYLFFKKWAESNGSSVADWYLDKDGYRNNSEIFQKKQ